jgi:hypothetical protein
VVSRSAKARVRTRRMALSSLQIVRFQSAIAIATSHLFVDLENNVNIYCTILKNEIALTQDLGGVYFNFSSFFGLPFGRSKNWIAQKTRS